MSICKYDDDDDDNDDMICLKICEIELSVRQFWGSSGLIVMLPEFRKIYELRIILHHKPYKKRLN